LELRPLIAFRDYHSTTHENHILDATITTADGLTSFKPYEDLPRLYLAHDSCEVQPTCYWYRNFEYRVEQERGLDFTEDLFNPCSFVFDLKSKTVARVLASTENTSVTNAEQYRIDEIRHRGLMASGAHAQNDLISTLIAAADQFIATREQGQTIIAGYHWFSDWGRDTMIALPGLTLTTGRPQIARSILREFARHVDRGMLPNRFPDAGETPEYNTVDATLWFFEAVRALLQYTSDYEFVRQELYTCLVDIIEWHIKGTRFNIHVDDDGLLFSGEPGVQLTWMDAKVDDWVVTPRHGKPVEIQALWYNALRIMQELSLKFKDSETALKYRRMADRARKSFNQQFWNEEAGCLYDVVNGEARDAAIRPNQVLAISLTNSMLTKTKAKRILEVVKRDLLTPRGLRTLSPVDPQYQGKYEGNPKNRDSVYHQGTVWPWLMGPYITACVKTFGEKSGRRIGSEWLSEFREHLAEACLGQISEIFDGDEPYTPRGCVAQAWSVAEILRTAVECVFTSEDYAASATAG
jgi:predicted glycogen debranching enzyme